MTTGKKKQTEAHRLLNEGNDFDQLQFDNLPTKASHNRKSNMKNQMTRNSRSNLKTCVGPSQKNDQH